MVIEFVDDTDSRIEPESSLTELERAVVEAAVAIGEAQQRAAEPFLDSVSKGVPVRLDSFLDRTTWLELSRALMVATTALRAARAAQSPLTDIKP